jgi:hypothetical protein
LVALRPNNKNEEDMSMALIRFLRVLVVLHLFAYIPSYAWAGGYESSFRCRTDVIMLGDSNYKVLARCGPPIAKDSIGTNYSPIQPPGEFRDLEQWVYNLGPTNFIYTLKFQGGALVEIYRGDRGF